MVSGMESWAWSSATHTTVAEITCPYRGLVCATLELWLTVLHNNRALWAMQVPSGSHRAWPLVRRMSTMSSSIISTLMQSSGLNSLLTLSSQSTPKLWATQHNAMSFEKLKVNSFKCCQVGLLLKNLDIVQCLVSPSQNLPLYFGHLVVC